MDTDPLQDAPPARYAVESDSEDEVGFYPGPKPTRAKVTYTIHHQNTHVGESGLIVACGAVGMIWASGLEGQVMGSITVDGINVVEYRITPSKILLAIVTHRLPLGAQHGVAKTIVEAQSNSKPCSIVVIDAYSFLGYISSQQARYDEHPVRYLKTSDSLTKPLAKPFETPNLLQHLSAALIAECEYLQRPATALLAPVRLIPPPAPTQPTAYNPSIDTALTTTVLRSITTETVVALGIESTQLAWGELKVKPSALIGNKDMRPKRGDIGEGGMYI